MLCCRRWLYCCYFGFLLLLLAGRLISCVCCTGEYFCWHLITFNRSIHCISIKFFAALKKCCSCCFFFIRRNQVSRVILSNKFVSKMISCSSRSIELLSKLKLFQTIQWCIDFSTYANIFLWHKIKVTSVANCCRCLCGTQYAIYFWAAKYVFPTANTYKLLWIEAIEWFLFSAVSFSLWMIFRITFTQ